MVLRSYQLSTFLVAKVMCCATICVLVLATTDTASGSNRETPVVRLVREASPSVVNIHGHKTVRSVGQGQSFQQVNGMGTGVIIDPRGYVITNFHVVQDVNDIRIALSNGRPAVARVIAHDLRTDLAVLKIDTKEALPVIKIGSSKDLWVGETVVAIGNAYGYEHTVTQGLISALHRDIPFNEQHYTDLIQTSAEINPGNSGGPLLNLDGQMIGINVAVRVGAQGIAFTIPVDQVLDIVSDLLRQKTRTRIVHGVRGRTEWESEEESVFVVTGVTKGSVAEVQGIKLGARIREVNGYKIHNHLDFELAMLELDGRTALEFEVSDEKGDLRLVSLHTPDSERPRPTLTGVAERVWNTFGIQGDPVPEATMQALNRKMDTAYGAGLEITAVRSGSPASRQGLRSGDILLGILDWQTSSLNDLDYILRSDEVQKGNQSQFFIIRANQTMVGYLQPAGSNRRTRLR